jgi:F-type H+-transporting ATPase subunit epsilon
MAEGETPNAVAFELVCPDRLVISESVEMVVVPGAEGDFGVLPRHAPLVATLRNGVIAVYEGGAVTTRVFVGGGVAEVTPDRCTVLAEEAAPLAEIDREAVEARIESESERAEIAETEVDKQSAEASVAVARAMLAALDQYGAGGH